MNPVIKFTTLFGLLAVELGVYLSAGGSSALARGLAVAFFVASLVFVHRSFYGMRIETQEVPAGAHRPVPVKA
jgi:K(+)-stimulated pyrophosphate-energized sodium pump